MKNYSEIFNRLEELPVSEETLGAYIEGNLPAAEEVYMSELIDSDPDLYMIYDLAENDGSPVGLEEIDFPEQDFELLELPDTESSYGPEPSAPSMWMSEGHTSASFFDDGNFSSGYERDGLADRSDDVSADWDHSHYMNVEQGDEPYDHREDHDVHYDEENTDAEDSFGIGSHDDFTADC